MRNVEYRPSRRSSAPFSPSGAASYAARIASLYFAVNVRPTRAFGHLRVRPCRASAIHRTRIFDPGPSVKPGQADRHVGEVSIPALKSMIVRGRVPQPRLAERVASSVDNSMIESFWSTLKVRLPGCWGVARLVGELSLQKV